MVRQRNESIPSRDINDQRILESHSSHGASGHTQPWVEVKDVTFPVMIIFSVILLTYESCHLIEQEA